MYTKKAAINNPNRCLNCIHYHQHYVKICSAPERYSKCFCGHCTARNAKSVREDRTCDDFRRKTE